MASRLVSRHKRTRDMERVGKRARSDVDMISSLPDCLIHVIMSFLTAQEAVQTCVLSKRWEKLWTTLPFLDFDMSKFDCDPDGNYRINGKFERFLDFVSMTLLNRETSVMHKFHVSFSGKMRRSSKHAMFVRSWIVYTLKQNPQVFKFDPDVQGNVVKRLLPVGVFTCASLVDVSISRTFPPVGNIKVINLPALKRLYLRFIHLNQAFVEMLFCGCPVLEILHLKDCCGQYSTINSQSLKYLTVETCVPNLKDIEIELYNTPNLLSFCYTNGYSDENVVDDLSKMLLKMPSLACASININRRIGWSADSKNSILIGLSTVQNLALSGYMIKDLLAYELPNCLEFSNLKDLSVECLCLSCHFNLLAFFLNHCPNLEKLFLRHIGFRCEHGEEVHVNQESLKIAPFKGGRLKKVDVQFYRDDKSVLLVLKCLQDITENSGARIIMTSLGNYPYRRGNGFNSRWARKNSKLYFNDYINNCPYF
ncbi:FBD-associated F-box protein [Rhynchospora pubera]|uniref:FBD-associated F-box protein n=1 Tax=Rhynchospora pubera TaxID=906938 RepID=A0AAV8GY50_9POAL|nr:FBD-associated F-box protein [Rhynchospora pubera]